jgi:GNAT superfamily N-acetyltransferase
VSNPQSNDFCIELLAPHHNRAAFSCGNEQLDRYLHSVANQDKKKNIAIPYVIFDALAKPTGGNRQTIIGYYTLSMSGINLAELPEQIAKKLPKYPIVGVTLIGRLAVSSDYKGSGWGKLLIMDALHRSLTASKGTASFAVVVDASLVPRGYANDDTAVRFYQRFDFQPFPDSSTKLFRMMTNIDRAFSVT